MVQQLKDFIEKLKSNPRISSFNEAETKQAIVLPMLHVLGWNTHDVAEVTPEFSVESRRVDYALRVKKDKFFLEVKNTGEDLRRHEEQLLDYSYRQGVELATLTNGITWWFYLPMKKGEWSSRKFYTIDIIQQEIDVVSSKLVALLSRDNLLSGAAVKEAESIYEDRLKKKTIKDALPEAWNKIISDTDTLLVDLLAETAEKICGYKPDIEDVKQFLKDHKDRFVVSHNEEYPKESPVTKKPFRESSLRNIQRSKAGRVLLQELVDAGLIRNGQILYFSRAKEEQATIVASSNKLKYKDKLYSVSELAQILLERHNFKKEGSPVAGPWYWMTYDGKLLNDLNEKIRTQRGDR
jgi:hypothetical protein